MNKYTHVICLKDVLEEGIMIFKEGQIYKIVGFDYNSLFIMLSRNFMKTIYYQWSSLFLQLIRILSFLL